MPVCVQEEPLLKFQSTHPVWGATRLGNRKTADMLLFQSTHPVWGATKARQARKVPRENFNPRTPCGVRLDLTEVEGLHW